jgi:putative SOS response-associated peptidase YedK
MKPVHNRMPVVLDRADWNTWLSNDTPPEQIDALCSPAPDGSLEAVEVNTAVNSWKSFGPEIRQANWTWTKRPT